VIKIYVKLFLRLLVVSTSPSGTNSKTALMANCNWFLKSLLCTWLLCYSDFPDAWRLEQNGSLDALMATQLILYFSCRSIVDLKDGSEGGKKRQRTLTHMLNVSTLMIWKMEMRMEKRHKVLCSKHMRSTQMSRYERWEWEGKKGHIRLRSKHMLIF